MNNTAFEEKIVIVQVPEFFWQEIVFVTFLLLEFHENLFWYESICKTYINN